MQMKKKKMKKLKKKLRKVFFDVTVKIIAQMILEIAVAIFKSRHWWSYTGIGGTSKIFFVRTQRTDLLFFQEISKCVVWNRKIHSRAKVQTVKKEKSFLGLWSRDLKMLFYFLSAVLIFHQRKLIGKLKNMIGTQEEKWKKQIKKTHDVKMQSKK